MAPAKVDHLSVSALSVNRNHEVDRLYKAKAPRLIKPGARDVQVRVGLLLHSLKQVKGVVLLRDGSAHLGGSRLNPTTMGRHDSDARAHVQYFNAVGVRLL